MKKLSLLLSILILLIPVWAFAAGSVVTVQTRETTGQYANEKGVDVVFVCLGDATTGAIADTDISADALRKIQGMYLFAVCIQNTSAQADVTDNSDVYFKTEMGTDLLAGVGVDALDKDAENYVHTTVRFISGAIGTPYLSVSGNSGAASAYTVTLVFINEGAKD